MFYHSLLSDWNNGHAHFLRGVASELTNRGHEVTVFEPIDSWSLGKLFNDHWLRPLYQFQEYYPKLESSRYDLENLDLDVVLDGYEVVIAHEWNDAELIRALGAHRAQTKGYRLFFHDTGERIVSSPDTIMACNLGNYDGVLVPGEVLADLYRASGLAQRVWVWHPAADTSVFRPIYGYEKIADVISVDNWGESRTRPELDEYLIEPVKELGLKAHVHGVGYPLTAQRAMSQADILYRGWVANFLLPERLASFNIMVHVPRRLESIALAGVPPMQLLEAMACGIPMVIGSWDDAEGLFSQGRDYLVARTPDEMKKHLRALANDEAMRVEFASWGRATILARHTCYNRATELLKICESLEQNEFSRRAELFEAQKTWGVA